MSRVREDARSPLGVTAIAPPLVTCVLVGVLVLGELADPYVLAAAVLLVQLVLASSPSVQGRTRTPVRAPKLVPIALAGGVAAAATLLPSMLKGADGTTATAAATVDGGSLAGIGVALPVLVVVALLGQLRRPAPRADVVLALGDVVTTGTVALLATGWVAASLSPVGHPAVVVAAIVAVVMVAAERTRRPVLVVWSLALCALCGIVLASVEGVDARVGAAAAVAIGGAAVLGAAVGRRWRPLPQARWAMEVVAPIAFAGPVVFVATLIWAGI